MRRFITLIAPTDNADAVRAVMDQYDRAAVPIDNSSLRKTLLDSERQYLTTRRHCDCDSILSLRSETPEALEETLAKEAHRMSRKGWSETKIVRALDDRRKAHAKPSDSRCSDSLDLWCAVLRDLGNELRLPHAGLFVRYYSGQIATEAFSASRRLLPKSVQHKEPLQSTELDEVMIFPLT